MPRKRRARKFRTKSLGYRLQYKLAHFCAGLLNALPISVSTYLARRGGDLAYGILCKRRRTALANIDRAFGSSLTPCQKKRIARQSFQSAALSFVELFTIEKIRQEASGNFEIKGLSYLNEAFARGKGVLFVMAHLGSWEYLAFLPYLTHTPWSVVVKRIKNFFLNQRINALRRMTTLSPIEKNNSVKRVLKELKNNRGVAIIIDQWAGAEGVWTDFFGSPTSTTSIPARLHMKTGCTLLNACCIRRPDGRYEIQISPCLLSGEAGRLSEKDLTEKLNRQLESKIREYPEQWMWGHRRWKDKPRNLRMP